MTLEQNGCWGEKDKRLNDLKRAHCAHKRNSANMCQPNFQNFMHNHFNYWQIKVILSLFSSNVNPNHSIGN